MDTRTRADNRVMKSEMAMARAQRALHRENARLVRDGKSQGDIAMMTSNLRFEANLARANWRSARIARDAVYAVPPAGK